jgi:hypothetical protein
LLKGAGEGVPIKLKYKKANTCTVAQTLFFINHPVLIRQMLLC